MNEHSGLLICVISFHIVHVASQTSPNLIIPTAKTMVTLSKTEARETKLADDITCTGGENNSTRVYLQSANPTYPCGKCFAIYRKDGADQYRLMYIPSMYYSLEDTPGGSCLLYVVCTDDGENNDDDTKTILVILMENSPPTFDNPSSPYVTDVVKSTKNKRAGSSLLTVHAKDIENDAVLYTLEAEPYSDFFEIGYASGKIHATKDPRLLCDDSVEFKVSAEDDFNGPVNSVVMDVTLQAGNIRPVLDLTKTDDVMIPEGTSKGITVVVASDLTVTDESLYNKAIYKLRSEPERGLEYYELDVTKGGKVRIVTRKELDYEYEYLRTVTLYVDVTDGFCDAETYVRTVIIEDVNEVPVIVPDKLKRCVYEGFIEVDPGWRIIDPDEKDQDIRWQMTDSKFYIDQVSGIVYSKGDFDLDPNKPEVTRTLVAMVEDHDGETAKASLVLTIKDKNDNAPYFTSRIYKVTASNCTRPGALIGRVFAKDKDSERDGNKDLYYNGTGTAIAVLSTGHVTLTTRCVPGHTETIQAQVSDQGTYPGPLAGVPLTVQFTCNVCPEPDPTDNSNTTVTPDVDDGDDGDLTNDADSLALNLGWVLVAAILALLLAAVLAYVIWRYCTRACARWRKRRALRRKAGQRRPVNVKAADKKKKMPEQQVIVIPPPPTLPPPEPEPIFFSFWKETYKDRDQRHTPQRDVTPASVEKDRVMEERVEEEKKKEKEERKQKRVKVEEEYQENLERYHQDVQAIRNPPPPPPPKKKFCHIL